MPKLERTMFRDYDIRGEVNENELSAKAMGFIGKGFAKMLKEKGINKCVVGMDARPYNAELGAALMKGFTSSGINVVNLGMVTTPMAFFAQWHFDIKGLAMITASHNPNGWSGLKLGFDKSSTLLTADVKKLYSVIEEEDFVEGQGKIEKKSIEQAYIDEIKSKTNLGKKLKVVINCRNGIAGDIAPRLIRAIGCEVVELYCNVDDSYPHGVANPSLDSMLEELGEKVVEEKADLGLAFDADGDRLGAVDEKGQVIYADRLVILLARGLLEKAPKSKIIYEVKCTQSLPDDIKAHGGIPIMCRTGHSFIKQKLHETGAALAGERSGHIFFAHNWYSFDDAGFAAAKFLEYISMQEKTLSEIMETTPKYYSSKVYHAPCADEVKHDVVKRVVEHLKKLFPNVIDIDGARVVFEDGWGLVRTSSNLPVLVLVFEGKTKERLEEIEQTFRKELSNFPEISPDWRNG